MKKYLFIVVTILLLASCSETVTLGTQYPKMYSDKPTSIVIMPPINKTNFVQAKEYFYTTLYGPLCEKGYYVFSPMMTMDLFKGESAYDSEMFINGDLKKFRSILGADACMFTTIKSWKRNNLGGVITVDVEYTLKSTRTNEILYQREGLIHLDTSVGVSGGGLFGALINMAATAISTATTDKVIAGRRCSAFVLSNLPAGVYDEEHYNKDEKSPAGKSFVKATVK